MTALFPHFRNLVKGCLHGRIVFSYMTSMMGPILLLGVLVPITHAQVLNPTDLSGHSKLLDSLESILQDDTTRNEMKVEVLNMLGRLYTDRDMEKAKSLLHQSSSLADSIHDTWGKAQAYKYLGIIHDYQGYIAVSASYFQRAVATLAQDSSERFMAERYFIESYPAGRVILGPLTKQFVISRDSSIAYLEKCIAIKKSLNDHLGLADAYDHLAFEYWDKGYNEKAKNAFQKAMDLWQLEKEAYQKINFEDGVALATGKIGVGYQYLGDSATALTYYRKGFAMNRALGNKHYMARNCINLAHMNTGLKRMDSAKFYFGKAVDLASQIQAVVVIHRGFLELAKIYEAEGDFRNASVCYQKLFKSRDLHFSQSHLLTTIEMQAQYENQIKAAQIKRLELENQLKEDQLSLRYLIIIFLAALTVILIAGGYAFLRSRRRYLAKINAIETNHRIKYEKDRISKELHDNIGTRLTTLTLSLRELERKSTISSPAMELIRNDVQTVIAELRDSIWAINENEITLEEFSDKVRNLFWRFQQDNGSLNCKVSLLTNHNQVRLKPQVAINLFRIVQEAVANSIKHSGASELSAIVKYDHPSNLNVVISDNGTGFEVHANDNRNSHFGLQNMRSRAKEIGASLEIDSSKGTSVSILVTLTNNT